LSLFELAGVLKISNVKNRCYSNSLVVNPKRMPVCVYIDETIFIKTKMSITPAQLDVYVCQSVMLQFCITCIPLKNTFIS